MAADDDVDAAWLDARVEMVMAALISFIVPISVYTYDDLCNVE